jgi:tRNA A-37 threonylcarbamoyl transferase component Bud32/tetratricopeptide (TPR) repeat protein
MQLTRDTARNLLSGVKPRLDSKQSTMHQGDVIGDGCSILALIGSGAMGEVYKAQQISMDRIVAVKTLRSTLIGDGDLIVRFFREAKLLSALDHPNISKIYSLGVKENGQPYFVLDYVSGKPLSEYIEQETAWSETQFIDIFHQVVSALAHAHARGIVHRDIKPGNIMIEEAEGRLKVKLVDFGIAYCMNELSNQALTREGTVIGSPAYMSPEQCLGKQPDARSDLYSLGCSMYEVLTGRPPFFESEQSSLLRAHVLDAPAPLCQQAVQIDCDPRLLFIVEMAMQKDLARRYQSAEEMLADLERIKLHQSIRACAVRPATNNVIPRWHLNKTLLSVVMGLVVAFFMVVGYYWHVTSDVARARQLDRAETLVHKANCRIFLRQYSDADDLLGEAVAIYGQQDFQGAILGDIEFNRGRINSYYRRYAQAIPHLQRALASHLKYTPAATSDTDVAAVREELVRAYLQVGLHKEALPLMEEMEKYYQLQPDDETPRTKVHILNLQRLSHEYVLHGRYHDAARVDARLLKAERTCGAPAESTDHQKAQKLIEEYDQLGRL